jgi:hypothetical protein
VVPLPAGVPEAGIVVACPCGEVYELRREYAGRLLQCPVCERRLRAPRLDGAHIRTLDVDPAFHRDVFLLNQRALTISSQYEVWSEQAEPILYVVRPTYPVRTVLAYVLGVIAASLAFGWVAPLVGAAGETFGPLVGVVALAMAGLVFVVVSMSARPLRHVTVFRDASRREALLRVRQDQRVAVLSRSYTVMTPAGEPLARLRKRYVSGLVRKRWDIDSPAPQRLACAIEDSVVLSLLRRVLGTFFGLLRTNFLILGRDGAVLGEFNRKLTLFDRYVIDVRGDVEGILDRRVVLALGVMLDTGERR